MKKQYYDKTYFSWQEKAGKYGATQDSWMYKPFISEDMVILDFGCGGGFMLEALSAKEKYGVDINPIARLEAKKKGLPVFKTLSDIPKKEQFDVIISHHTLEHVPNPV